MGFDTVIFDLDGTLIDSLDDMADSVNYALGACGYPLRSVAEIRSFIGHGVERIVELAVPDGTAQEGAVACLAAFRKHYTDNIQNKTCPYPGIMDLLKALKERGFRMAVVSNKFDPGPGLLCRSLFPEYIEAATGASENVRRKPAPDSVAASLRKLGRKKETAILVGDSDVDVLTAKNAGIPCVGVTWGFQGRKKLEEAGADFIIDSPAELLAILDSSVSG